MVGFLFPSKVLSLTMVESHIKKIELQREIVTLWKMYDGQDLDKLTLDQLTTFRDLLKVANDYLSSLKN